MRCLCIKYRSWGKKRKLFCRTVGTKKAPGPELQLIDVPGNDAYTRGSQVFLGGVFCFVSLEHSGEGFDSDVAMIQRRATLAHLYNTLPEYGCTTFWHAIEEPDTSRSLPLEVLVRCLRAAVIRGDDQGRKRILETIIRRTQTANEYWVNNIFKNMSLPVDERKALASDLYANLCEGVIRALLDPQRTFWEENFWHSLRFERKHAYATLMVREGYRRSQYAKQGERIPRTLIKSLDQPVEGVDGREEVDIEDGRAQQALLAVEHTDLLRLVLRLPQKLKAVVLLMFWEDRSEKDTARILGISDRTVRNRLQEVSKILRSELELEREGSYG